MESDGLEHNWELWGVTCLTHLPADLPTLRRDVPADLRPDLLPSSSHACPCPEWTTRARVSVYAREGVGSATRTVSSFEDVPRTLLPGLTRTGRAIKLGHFVGGLTPAPFSLPRGIGCMLIPSCDIGVAPRAPATRAPPHFPQRPYFRARHVARRFGMPRTSLER